MTANKPKLMSWLHDAGTCYTEQPEEQYVFVYEYIRVCHPTQ